MNDLVTHAEQHLISTTTFKPRRQSTVALSSHALQSHCRLHEWRVSQTRGFFSIPWVVHALDVATRLVLPLALRLVLRQRRLHRLQPAATRHFKGYSEGYSEGFARAGARVE